MNPGLSELTLPQVLRSKGKLEKLEQHSLGFGFCPEGSFKWYKSTGKVHFVAFMSGSSPFLNRGAVIASSTWLPWERGTQWKSPLAALVPR